MHLTQIKAVVYVATITVVSGCNTSADRSLPHNITSVFGSDGSQVHSIQNRQISDFPDYASADTERPALAGSLLLDEARAPTGAIPKGFHPVYMDDSPLYRAVIGRKSYGKTDNQTNYPQNEIFLYKKPWRRLGEIKHLGMMEGFQEIYTRWNKDGSQLGIACINLEHLRIGVADPRARTFQCASFNWQHVSPRAILWLDREIILICTDLDHYNEIYVFDPSTHKLRFVYSDAHEYIASAVASPDNIHVALARNSFDPARLGIWVLNTMTGSCRQVTFEANGSYFHRLGGWESSNSLCFLKQNQLFRIEFAKLP